MLKEHATHFMTKGRNMVALEPPVCNFDWPAPSFELPGTDGKTHSLQSVTGPNGTLVMFICNHCPYVVAITDRLREDMKVLQNAGIGVIAIMSNDTETYPADSFDNMKTFASDNGFTFPYVIDETQESGKTYGAICTPDFFGFNNELKLQYRGRLDASGRNPSPPDAKRELVEAMLGVARTGKGPDNQIASIGCSIKWR
jgi:peroxiredoxin